MGVFVCDLIVIFQADKSCELCFLRVCSKDGNNMFVSATYFQVIPILLESFRDAFQTFLSVSHHVSIFEFTYLSFRSALKYSAVWM